MENTNWTLEKNDRTPLKLYEDFKKSEKRKEQRWKILSLISSGGFVLSLFVMLFAITRPKTIPLVISVNDIGEARYIGDVSNYSYSGIKIPREAYENQFRRFVKNMFEVSTDFQVLKNNLNDCYYCLGTEAAQKFKNYIDDSNPRSIFGKEIRTVDVSSILNLSKNTYQIDFVINVSQRNGQPKNKIRMRGVFTCNIMQPNSEKERIANPLGIFITNFDFYKIESKEK